MSSNKELLELFKRVLWIEKQMKESYSIYKNMLSDKSLIDTLQTIESDEARHINMAERIVSILQNKP